MGNVKKDRQLKIFLILCVTPALLLTLYFMVLPTIKVGVMSVFNVTATGGTKEFVGGENFAYLLRDEYFISAFVNTIKLILIVPVFTITLAIILAVIITQSNLKEKNFYRIILFMPSILSTTVIGILWSFIYHPNMGIVNYFLRAMGLDSLTRAWLGDPQVVLYAIAVVIIWINVGYYMVMYIAGIDSIPKGIYEAAEIDGANKVSQFIYITVPLLWNIVRVTIILCVNTVLGSSFVLVTIMTNGGPYGSSSVLLQYMYQQAFTNSNFGYAMAISVVTLVLSFTLSKVSNVLTNKG